MSGKFDSSLKSTLLMTYARRAEVDVRMRADRQHHATDYFRLRRKLVVRVKHKAQTDPLRRQVRVLVFFRVENQSQSTHYNAQL